MISLNHYTQTVAYPIASTKTASAAKLNFMPKIKTAQSAPLSLSKVDYFPTRPSPIRLICLTFLLSGLTTTPSKADVVQYYDDGRIISTTRTLQATARGQGLLARLLTPRKTKSPLPQNKLKTAPQSSAVPSVAAVSASVKIWDRATIKTQIIFAAKRNGIPPELFTQLVRQESGYNIHALSTAGAYGLAQLMPATANGLGVDRKDPAQNLDGGARYLAIQYKKFGRWDLALAAYNAGPGAVEKYNGIPPYKETRHYVATILGRTGNIPKAKVPQVKIARQSAPTKRIHPNVIEF